MSDEPSIESVIGRSTGELPPHGGRAATVTAVALKTAYF